MPEEGLPDGCGSLFAVAAFFAVATLFATGLVDPQTGVAVGILGSVIVIAFALRIPQISRWLLTVIFAVIAGAIVIGIGKGMVMAWAFLQGLLQ